MFYYFPDNYRWSLAVLRSIAAGGLFGEIDWACSKLQESSKIKPSGDLEAWHEGWKELAQQLEDMADQAVTDGKDIWAFRYSSDDQSPSMYFGSPHTRASGDGLNSITTIASEPSDSDAAHWFKVEERNGVHWTEHGLEHFQISI